MLDLAHDHPIDPHPNHEAAEPAVDPADVEGPNLACEDHVERATRIARQPELPAHHVPGPDRHQAHRQGGIGQALEDLPERTVTADGDDEVDVRSKPPHPGCAVAALPGEVELGRDPSGLEALGHHPANGLAPAAPRDRVGDDQGARKAHPSYRSGCGPGAPGRVHSIR